MKKRKKIGSNVRQRFHICGLTLGIRDVNHDGRISCEKIWSSSSCLRFPDARQHVDRRVDVPIPEPKSRRSVPFKACLTIHVFTTQQSVRNFGLPFRSHPWSA